MHPPLMALQVQPDRPARAEAIEALMRDVTADVLLPIAHGPAVGPEGSPEAGQVGEAYYIVCPMPPSRPLGIALRPWSEAELLQKVLRPAAETLAVLAQRGTTHRSIRLDNVFRAHGGGIILGGAWAAPPASLQPALYEPPYMAMCVPSGRGDGNIADDVYALGVVLLALTLGRLPLAGLDETAILQRKIDLGSFQAMVGDERLPHIIADLTRGMLAEDPDHRPPPELLADPMLARTRRVAARPPRRSSRALEIGQQGGFNARGVALAMTRDPVAGVAALRDGRVERWLRRGLGDTTLASRMEDATALRAELPEEDELADNALLAKAIAILDPLAPLYWRGMALWPDGVGPALVAARDNSAANSALAEMLNAEIIGTWAIMREERLDPTPYRREARRLRSLLNSPAEEKANADGLRRLRYQLNPFLPCASPLLGGSWVARMQDLLPALEARAAALADTSNQPPPYDRDIAAFVNARSRQRDERDETLRYPHTQPALLARTQFWLYASLQSRQHKDRAFPGLARWLVSQASPLIEGWEYRPQREAVARKLADVADKGMLPALLATLDDPDGRAIDQRGAMAAGAMVARIDAELRQIAQGGPDRADLARRMGQELASGTRLAGLAASLTALAFG